MLTREELANVQRALFMLRAGTFEQHDADIAVAEITRHLPPTRAAYFLVFDALARRFDALPQNGGADRDEGEDPRSPWPAWKLN